ncbi:MAG: FAD-dependent oxidoreductase [Solirubrobacterales bacterium]|nr:FAD-dependent oxidoreductase [Solirubrobacterales bacterium]
MGEDLEGDELGGKLSGTCRQFLQASGRGTLALALGAQLAWSTGCGPGGDGKSASSAPNWDSLQKELTGDVLVPGSKGFELRSRPFNGRYADIVPQGVAVCADASDVQHAVRFATAEGLPVAVRSGGHNYAGYCSGPGLVVNLGSMRGVRVNDAAGTVTAQPVPSTRWSTPTCSLTGWRSPRAVARRWPLEVSCWAAGSAGQCSPSSRAYRLGRDCPRQCFAE